jgi:hypothetical protein
MSSTSSIPETLDHTMQEYAQKRMRDPAQRRQVAAALMQMFTNLRKKPVTDLDRRVQTMRQQIDRAVEDMSLQFVRGELVIKVAGSAELLINLFRRGSDWFQPEPDVDKIVLAAMLTDPKRS